MKCAIILVSPKGALNVGGIARLMKNFGLSDLRIVEPRCRLDSLECKQMAMHGWPIVEAAKIFPSLTEAQSDRRISIALSGRSIEDRRPRADLYAFSENFRAFNVRWDDVALVFGREETGLHLEELDQCDLKVTIPTTEEYSSLNLTSAAAITLSYLYHQWAHPSSQDVIPLFEPPSKKQEDVFFERLTQFLWDIKFANPQNPKHTLDDIRAIYHRAQLSDRELRILFGILTNTQKLIAEPHQYVAKSL